MAIRPNKYSDPNIGAAFEGIASLFAPTSAGDLQGYANADKLRAEAALKAQQQGLVDLYVNGGNERAGIGGGLFTPNQSMEAVRIGDATNRYGMDRTYAASTENNARDNTRALQSTVLEGVMNPLAQGETRQTLDAEVLAALGLEGTPTIPGFAGAPKPLSKEQVEGQMLQDKALSDPAFADWVLGGSKNPIAVLGAEGQPVMAAPHAAAGMGVYENPGAPKLTNYVTPEGQRGTALETAQGLVDPATGQPVPQGSTMFSGSVQASNPNDLNPTGALANDIVNERARIQSTTQTVGRLLDIMDTNASRGGTFNAVARLRNEAGNIQQAITEATSSLPANMTAADAKAWSDSIAAQVGATHDPSVRQALNLYTDLVYQMARRSNPRGEVGRYHLEQAMKVWGLDNLFTANDAQIRGLLGNMLEASKADWAINEDRQNSQPAFDPSSIDQMLPRTRGAAPVPAAAPAASPSSGPAVQWEGPIPDEAIAELLAAEDKGQAAIEFDGTFGPGAAAIYLGGR